MAGSASPPHSSVLQFSSPFKPFHISPFLNFLHTPLKKTLVPFNGAYRTMNCTSHKSQTESHFPSSCPPLIYTVYTSVISRRFPGPSWRLATLGEDGDFKSFPLVQGDLRERACSSERFCHYLKEPSDPPQRPGIDIQHNEDVQFKVVSLAIPFRRKVLTCFTFP